jgi:hypothetical protein
LAIISVSDNLACMGKLEDIKKSLEALSPQEQREMADWFVALRERLFDEQIERDSLAGKLDALGEEALADLRAGRTTPL